MAAKKKALTPSAKFPAVAAKAPSSKKTPAERSAKTSIPEHSADAPAVLRQRKTTKRTPSVRTRKAMAAPISPSADEIRERAYQIYLERGATQGDPDADWAQAERDLTQDRLDH